MSCSDGSLRHEFYSDEAASAVYSTCIALGNTVTYAPRPASFTVCCVDEDGSDPYAELASCPVRFCIGSHVLSLSLGSLEYISLELSRADEGETIEIAYDDQSNFQPHLFRWSELETLSRAIAAVDDSLPHPGAALLLLCRFAPVTDEDDAAHINGLLEAAWDRLGVLSPAQRRDIFDHIDARGAGFTWVRDERGRWRLTQPREEPSRYLHTLRSPESAEFPFDVLTSLLDEASRFAGDDGIAVHPMAPAPALRSFHLAVDHEGGFPEEGASYVAQLLDRWLRDRGLGSAQLGGISSRNGVRLSSSIAAHARCAPSEILVPLADLFERAGALHAIQLSRPRASGWPRLPARGLSVQLTNLSVRRWETRSGDRGVTLDRAPLDGEQRSAIARVLDERGAGGPDAGGWRTIALGSGNRLRCAFVDLDRDPTLSGGSVEADEATLEAAEHLLAIARAASLYILPPLVAPSAALAAAIDTPWPGVAVAEDAASLLDAFGAPEG